ncbi:MAG: hypothetical protein KJO43_02630 [Phycisphaerae bacterium]|nr:hypothetical protein [Phycisphaerae bacterium]
MLWAIDGTRTFRSPPRPEPSPVRTAAVYCSDGTITEHVDAFLLDGLKLPRCDRVMLPGGPARLAGHAEETLRHDDIVAELRFLIDAHELERVILIQHEGCAYYRERLRVDEQEMPANQRTDLMRAASALRDATNVAAIDAYVARPDGDAMIFDAVAIQ